MGYIFRECTTTLVLVYTYTGGLWEIIVENMSDIQQKKPDLGLLEEDDEFEEFPAEGELI